MLRDAFIDLSVSHFNLSCVTIVGIPMHREEENESENYNVSLLYPNTDCIQIYQNKNHHGYRLGTSFWKTERAMELRWMLQDIPLNPHILPSISLHRITPYKRSSPPTLCLIKWTCSKEGVPAYLVSSSVSDSQEPNTKPTHMLILHSGSIYFHKLATTSLDISVLPQFYNCNLDNFRLEDFKKQILTPNILLYSDPEKARKSNRVMKLSENNSTYVKTKKECQGIDEYLTSGSLDRTTRYYPLSESKTIIFNAKAYSETLKVLIDPIISSTTHSIINNNDLKTICDNIIRIAKHATKNKPSLFPSKSDEERISLYKQLWSEIRELASKNQNNSKNHLKFMEKINSAWPEANPDPPEPEVQEVDPDKFRYKPVYAYEMQQNMDLENPKETEQKNVREDLRGQDKYGEKKMEDPKVVDIFSTVNKNSLFYNYWKKDTM